MGVWTLLAALLALLGAAVWIAVAGWQSETVEMPTQAYVAMALGIFFSIVVGSGLMALIFYSSRKGYDEPSRRRETETKDDTQ